ncbi:MAG: restriction endonuclease subunit S, partial [Lactococcus sp.]
MIKDVDHKMPRASETGFPYISTKDFTKEGIDFSNAKIISEEDFTILSKRIQPCVGDIIFPRYGTIGETRRVTDKRKFLVSYSSVIIKNELPSANGDFLYLYTKCKISKSEINRYVNKSTQPNVGLESIKQFLVPFPPQKEQLKILKEVNNAKFLIDQIDQEQTSVQRLATQLKKRVLDIAMQGKLVPQDPNDEPASVLLEKIRAEKQRLFEEGKLKKKDLEEITPVNAEDNAYYGKLPKTWVLTKLENV